MKDEVWPAWPKKDAFPRAVVHACLENINVKVKERQRSYSKRLLNLPRTLFWLFNRPFPLYSGAKSRNTTRSPVFLQPHHFLFWTSSLYRGKKASPNADAWLEGITVTFGEITHSWKITRPCFWHNFLFLFFLTTWKDSSFLKIALPRWSLQPPEWSQ